MRIFAVYVAILFMLTPMIAHGAIENGMTLSDSEGVKIGEYEESTIVLDTIFDEAFESVIFEIESSSESEIITVMLYNGMFDYPANLNEYYILADAEPANAKYMHGEDTTEIEIEIEPGVTSVEIFGKIVKQDTKDATESMEVEDMMESVEEESMMESVEEESMMESVEEDMMESVKAENMMECVRADGGECVLVSNDISFKGLIYGIAGSAIIALSISLLLAAISKISKRK